jgi:uncharacterized protein involved in exopolysaccharide biosynthesis
MEQKRQPKSASARDRIRLLARSAEFLQFVGVAIALTATLISFLSFGVLSPSGSRIDDLRTQLEQVASQLATTGETVANLTSQVDAISRPADASALAARLDAAEGNLGDLESRVSRIEDAISNDPARALEVPLLRRDLDNLAGTVDSKLGSMQDSIDRIYDLSKWFLGALTVSILSLFLGTFLKGKAPTP